MADKRPITVNEAQRLRQLQCPPLIRKRAVRRVKPKEPRLEHEPIPKYINNKVSLDPHYDKSLDASYLSQIYPSHSYVGEGSFGFVLIAQNKYDKKKYAIKKLKGSSTETDRLTEIRNNEKVGNHPNLVQYYLSWQQYADVYMVLQACQLSLADFARLNSNVGETTYWDLLLDMCGALQFLHDKSLIHLDVKPDNIMLYGASFKLGDFGTLLDLNDESAIRQDGDAKYLAAEVLKGTYTPACDIFSLGICMLELVCNIVLPSTGPLWHEFRQRKYPDKLDECVSQQLKVVIKLMTHDEYSIRPTARKLLSLEVMKDVRYRCDHGLREVYTQKFIENVERDIRMEADEDNVDTEPSSCSVYDNLLDNPDLIEVDSQEKVCGVCPTLPPSMSDDKENIPVRADNTKEISETRESNLNVTPESNFSLLNFIQDCTYEKTRSPLNVSFQPKVLFSQDETSTDDEGLVKNPFAVADPKLPREPLRMKPNEREKRVKKFPSSSTPITSKIAKVCPPFKDDDCEADDEDNVE